MTTTALVKIETAYRALQEAQSIDEIKGVMDKAEVARIYIKRAGLGLEIQNSAADVKIQAERKAGRELSKLDLHGGDRKSRFRNGTLKLSDLGINKKQSHRWQKEAGLPNEIYEQHVAEINALGKELTSAGIINLANQFRREQEKAAREAEIIELEKQLPPTDDPDCFYKDDMTQVWLGDAGNLHFIEDNLIDMIVTSPPYNIGLKNGNGRVLWRGVEYSTTDDYMPEDKYQDWQVDVLNELWRACRPGGSLFYNHKIRNRKGQGIHPMTWISRSQWVFRQQIIWDRGSTHNKEMTYFWPHDELIFWLTKGTDDVYLSPEGARMSTVWPIGFKTNTDHPAPFPKVLPARCIRAASREGDLVLDPFAGSLTTCMAARELKRRSIGVDISKEYVVKYSSKLYQGVLL